MGLAYEPTFIPFQPPQCMQIRDITMECRGYGGILRDARYSDTSLFFFFCATLQAENVKGILDVYKYVSSMKHM